MRTIKNPVEYTGSQIASAAHGLATAYRSLQLPDLSENVFLMLGISAGTYLALSFKKS